METVKQESVVRRSAIVIGGGLVGSLCVCLLAERRYKVTLYEKRTDIRKLKVAKGRSINLALSHRGRKGLSLAGIESKILENAIPMIGRFIHSKNGCTRSALYDPVFNQCIYSVERNLLNRTLLDDIAIMRSYLVAEKYENVSLLFNHKLVNVDFLSETITIQNANGLVKSTADIILGADGAFSTFRMFFQKTPLFNFSQQFIDHGYLELSIPAKTGGSMVPNHLHIWPRGEFMMIALPNIDQSWTVTLFMPFKIFEKITDEDKLLEFFKMTFPDALPLIGEDGLKKEYFETSPQPLVSIKCSRYHSGRKFLLIGDAAHAIVPFYGQGMNAGLEDCTLLNEILNEVDDDTSKTIKLFSERRQKDANAISDLALYNYREMRDLVTTNSYQIRKVVDKYLARAFPKRWIPLYNSVSFSHIRYSQCVENRNWQDRILVVILSVGFAVVLLLCVVLKTVPITSY